MHAKDEDGLAALGCALRTWGRPMSAQDIQSAICATQLLGESSVADYEFSFGPTGVRSPDLEADLNTLYLLEMVRTHTANDKELFEYLGKGKQINSKDRFALPDCDLTVLGIIALLRSEKNLVSYSDLANEAKMLYPWADDARIDECIALIETKTEQSRKTTRTRYGLHADAEAARNGDLFELKP